LIVWTDDIVKQKEDGRFKSTEVFYALTPQNEARFKRWKAILAKYNIEDNLSDADSSNAKPARQIKPWATDKDYVLSLSASCDDIAESYVTLRGGTYYKSKTIEDLLKVIYPYNITSVLIFGERHHFTAVFIQYLSTNLCIPWGIISGADLPAITFLAAKQFGTTKIDGKKIASINSIGNVFIEGRNNIIKNINSPLTANNLHSLICDYSWDALSVVAHGESNHCNLKTTVLCGFIEKHESIVQAKLKSECNVEGKTRQCRRVRKQDIEIIYFREINAKWLLLFTCNGFSISNDLYPSEVSSVLSAVEGSASYIITFSEPFTWESWQEVILLELLIQEKSLGDIQVVLNDLFMRRTASKPVVIFGDPTIKAALSPKPAIIQDKVLIQTKEEPSQNIVAFKSINSSWEILNGLKNYVLIYKGKRFTVPPEYIDKTALFKDYCSQVKKINNCLGRAVQFHYAISSFYESERNDIINFDLDTKLLKDIQGQLEETLFKVSLLLENSRQNGILHHHLFATVALAEMLVEVWDKTLANLLHNGLIQVPFHQLLIAGDKLDISKNRFHCNYCACSLLTWTNADETEPSKYLYKQCPNCGPQEVTFTDEPYVEVIYPFHISPSEKMKLLVQLKNFKRILPFGPKLIIQLKDNGQQKVVFRQSSSLKVSSCNVVIKIPEDNALEIHTLRVAIISGMQVHYLRVRTACTEKLKV